MPIITTGTKTTYFTNTPLNFDESTFRDYTVTWLVDPPFDYKYALRSLSYGARASVYKGYWLQNTEYLVNCTMVYRALPDLVGY